MNMDMTPGTQLMIEMGKDGSQAWHATCGRAHSRLPTWKQPPNSSYTSDQDRELPHQRSNQRAGSAWLPSASLPAPPVSPRHATHHCGSHGGSPPAPAMPQSHPLAHASPVRSTWPHVSMDDPEALSLVLQQMQDSLNQLLSQQRPAGPGSVQHSGSEAQLTSQYPTQKHPASMHGPVAPAPQGLAKPGSPQAWQAAHDRAVAWQLQEDRQRARRGREACYPPEADVQQLHQDTPWPAEHGSAHFSAQGSPALQVSRMAFELESPRW